MKKIVIFDMDGTLVDSKKDLTITLNYVRKTRYNLEPVSEKFVTDAINSDGLNLAKLFYNTDHYTKEDSELFSQHYFEQCVKNTFIYDGILELLESLKQEGFLLAVATNASTRFAVKMLKYLEIFSFFEIVLGADKVENPKPASDLLDTILVHLNFNTLDDKAWMIGDSKKDMLSAENAQIESLFANWGFAQEGLSYDKIQHPQEILDFI